MLKYFLTFFLFCCSFINAQQLTGIITGSVLDKQTGESLPGVNIIILGLNSGTASDEEGNFNIINIPVGTYQIKASYVGYESVIKTDVVISTARPAIISFELIQSTVDLEDIVVSSSYFENSSTGLGSTKTLSYEEIRRSPGGFEDVLRALSIVPGVAQANPGRNDLVVRGGAPSENLYLVDNFIIPNINHFGTQGANGGALSYINLDFVDNTEFSTGGFSVLYGDKLSSVLSIKLRDGRKDKLGGKATISASQFGLNLEGPINNNSSFLFSVRRSYLDFIFNAAGFNFVPEYYDGIAKYDYNFSNHDKLSILFIGAYDNVKFNNDEKEDIFDNARILGTDQQQYMFGTSYRHLFGTGFLNISFNRNYVNFDSFQNDTLLNPIFKNKSTEAENTLKLNSVFKISSNAELDAGFSANIIHFKSDIKLNSYNSTFGDSLPLQEINTSKNFIKGDAYINYSSTYFSMLKVTGGIRLDYFNGINKKYYVSPRLSFSFPLRTNSNVTLSGGEYHQFPSFIWLAAYKSNKDLKAIKVQQLIAGIDNLISEDIKIKLEGFYKSYSNYPASLSRDYIVLSNVGAGYGGTNDNFSSFGLEPLISKGKGRASGLELSIQKKSSSTPGYGIMSLTYSKATYTALDKKKRNGQYDQRWIFNFSGGYIFNNKWEASLKFRYASGAPYTPYNNDGTQSINKFNTSLFPAAHSLDIRVDRRWNFEGWTLITYIDIQNIYNRKNSTNIRWDYFERKEDTESAIGLLPSIGISAEF